MSSKNKITRRMKLLSAFLAIAFSLNLVSNTYAYSSGNSGYRITEEASEFSMPNQPTASFWFPKELLKWNPQEDKDANFNKAAVPLAKRVDKSRLDPVNSTQNKDMKVVALSIMNASTSGNPSQGSSKFEKNVFSYWQYIDKLVYWGGSSGEGLIVPPSADVTDSAHRNGVPVLGTIFFPPAAWGGKLEWLNQFLQKDASGNFPMVDKLLEVTKTYNFDGWFINQETEGTEKDPLTKEHAVLMQEFIKQFRSKANGKAEIMWYDAMTKDGEIDYQEALTEKNDYFLIDSDKKPVANSMFLDFWWTHKTLVEKKLLEASNKRAKEIGVNPYDIYAGVDVQAKGVNSVINWDLFESGTNSTNTSLGLYCPSWTYFSANSMEDFQSKENRLWVNEEGDPSASTQVSGTGWKGISTYAIEKNVVNKTPFNTNFNLGNGYSFFIKGAKVSSRDWNNRSLADIMPTYRWIIKNEGNNQLNASIDYSTAYYGGNSIKFLGNLDAKKSSTIKLFSADLTLSKGLIFSTSAKSSEPVNLDLVLNFHDGSSNTIKANKSIGTDWTTVTYDVSKLINKSIKTISYKISSKTEVSDLAFNLGNVSIQQHPKSSRIITASGLKIDEAKFDDENIIYAGVRLSWNKGNSADVNHYEIYRINDDKTKSFLGATPNNVYFVNSLLRDEKSNKTTFEVIPVNNYYVQGKASNKVVMEWPANNIPKANFKASRTLVAPGGKITFTNLSSIITKNVEWSFPGANVETSTENNPTISYAKEGTYSVKLTAKNENGQDVKEIKALIVVSAKVKDELVNLSQEKETTADSFVNNNEANKFAVDGNISKKWCAVGTLPHWLVINLGDVKTISEVRIAHAEAGNESPDMNTKKYEIQTSVDGVNYTSVVNVTKNAAGNTIDTFAPVQAKYVKLIVNQPTQGSDSAARIYEVQVFGIDAANPLQ